MITVSIKSSSFCHHVVRIFYEWHLTSWLKFSHMKIMIEDIWFIYVRSWKGTDELWRFKWISQKRRKRKSRKFPNIQVWLAGESLRNLNFFMFIKESKKFTTKKNGGIFIYFTNNGRFLKEIPLWYEEISFKLQVNAFTLKHFKSMYQIKAHQPGSRFFFSNSALLAIVKLKKIQSCNSETYSTSSLSICTLITLLLEQTISFFFLCV